MARGGPAPYKNVIIIDNADMSTSINSDVFDNSGCSSVSIQSVFTGSPNGTLQVLVALDPNGTFTTYSGSELTITAAGDFVLEASIKSPYFQVVYTDAGLGGTGILTTTVYASQGV